MKKASIASLKKKLDLVFKAWIRTRDLQHDGTFVCISCGETKQKDQMHGGHFWAAGKHTAIRWDEDNCHGQCIACNTFLHGNLYKYGQRLAYKIGMERMQRLEDIRNTPVHLDRQWLEERIEFYKLYNTTNR